MSRIVWSSTGFRGVDQANPHVLAKRHQQPSLEWRCVVEQHGVGNHSPLAHGRDDRTHGGSHVWIEEHITKNIPAVARPSENVYTPISQKT
jgi:hypothetical protein